MALLEAFISGPLLLSLLFRAAAFQFAGWVLLESGYPQEALGNYLPPAETVKDCVIESIISKPNYFSAP